MSRTRKRLTYANVMSSVAVFLALTGATAFAATQLGKNSVGSKQLKKNSVTTAKIKGNAVTSAKIKKNAVTTAKVKDGAITGAKINAGSTGFSQVVARLHNAGPVSFGTETPVPLGSYTQPAGEDDQYVGGLEVTFGPSCTAPREVIAYLIADPAKPSEPEELDVAGIAVVVDETGASSTHRGNFVSSLPSGPFGLKGLTSFAPPTNLSHSFYVYLGEEECDTGSGVTASNLGVDVIGTK